MDSARDAVAVIDSVIQSNLWAMLIEPPPGWPCIARSFEPYHETDNLLLKASQQFERSWEDLEPVHRLLQMRLTPSGYCYRLPSSLSGRLWFLPFSLEIKTHLYAASHLPLYPPCACLPLVISNAGEAHCTILNSVLCFDGPQSRFDGPRSCFYRSSLVLRRSSLVLRLSSFAFRRVSLAIRVHRYLNGLAGI